MMYKLRLSVFRFDAKCDYLPFYKKHFISIDGEDTLSNLLEKVKEEDRLFDYPMKKNAAIAINGENLFTDVKIIDIVEHFGDELTLEPMSTKRAQKDLIINKDDFYKKFDLLDAFVDSNDKKRFDELVTYHYASDFYKYSDQFQGDALFIFAQETIQKHPSQKKNILKVIDNGIDGIWLHTNICGKTFPTDFEVENKINRLQNIALQERN